MIFEKERENKLNQKEVLESQNIKYVIATPKNQIKIDMRGAQKAKPP